MDIATYRQHGGGYIAIWRHNDECGRAYSSISPEQAEKNALAQARRKLADMTDYCGEPQAYSISRKLYETIGIGLAETFTASEAAEAWNLESSTVKKACQQSRFHSGESRKSGKIWLVTAAGMERLYGPRPGEKENENE